MKVTAQPAISLDGFIARTDGDSDTWVNSADEARYKEAVKKAGCVLVGRTTYEQYIDDFNEYQGVSVFVCSKRPDYKDTDYVKHVRGSAHEIISAVEKSGFDELVVCGGGEVNGLLATAGLIDEIVISIQPVVLGEGISLFGHFQPSLNLELISTDLGIEGVVQNHYKVIK